MPTFLRLQLENFKSYRSLTTIEWKQVSSILGQNGTGKSTIVDAVEYVFCFPRYSKKSIEFLRKELYHKHSKEDEHSCSWVSAVVNVGDEEREFKRAVDYNHSVHKYWIDNREVDLREYKKFLLRVNINPRANHFLVQQNSIQSLALKNAKQRTEFFEVLSNSVGYKSEYNRLASDMKDMQTEVKSSQSILDLHHREKRNLIQKSKEIEIYDDLTEKLEKAEFDYHYIKLYKVKTNIDYLLEQEEKKQESIREINEKLTNEYEVKIAELKTKIAEKEKQVIDLESELEGRGADITNYRKKKAELEEKMKNYQSEIVKVTKNLEKATEIDEAHCKTLQNLKKQISEIKEERNKHNSSLPQSCSLELNEEQYKNYLKLKEESQKLYAEEMQSCLSLERESDQIKDIINEFENNKAVLLNRIKREKSILSHIEVKRENVKKKCEETMKAIRNTEKEIRGLQVNQLRVELEIKINEIQDYNKQLNYLDVEQEESSSRRRLNEITDTLVATFSPRVLGRLSSLCKVADKKYEIAITKILGSKMDGIVVDTTNTAKECIEFLKEKYRDDRYSAIATFFPLDAFRGNKSLSKEMLGKIESATYAKLAIDLMKTGKIDNMLKNFLGDTVICETDDQARDFSNKLRCVSLNGTDYRNDGTFSGGCRNIRKKAKQWDEGKYKKIEKNKQEKTKSLRALQLEIRGKEIKQNDLEMQLQNLQRRLQKYLKPELEKCEEELKTQKDHLKELENDLKTFESESQINKLKTSLKDIQKKLDACKKREREIEDQVFSDFCKKLKLENIRVYEEDDVRVHEEFLKKKVDIDNHLSTTKNQYKLAKSRDTKTTIDQLKERLDNLNEELKKLSLEIKEHTKDENEHKQLDKNKTAIKNIRFEIKEMKKALDFEERRRTAAKKDLREIELTAEAMNSRINQLRRVETHQILTKCKIKGINIPLKQGTIKKVVIRSKVLGTESESSSLQLESNTAILEQDVEIDFTPLTDCFQEFEGNELNDEMNKRLKFLESEQANLKEKLHSCTPSNRDLNSELDSLKTKIADAKKDLLTKQEQLKAIEDEFEEVKRKRSELFINFCNSVEKEIDQIFKSLYNKDSAQASIVMINPDEPYLDGISLSFLVPGKRFALMEHLSGGEKTMCAMALFLAIFSAKPAPCIIFDEIDAALDNTNLQNIVNLFLKWKQTTQIISISHHECLVRCADAAIGINISARKNSSYAIHVDLTRYLNPVHLSSSLSQATRTPTASPRAKSTSSSDKRTTVDVRLPSLSSSSRRSTMDNIGAPVSASTPSKTAAKQIKITSIEIVPPTFVSRKRKADGFDEDES